MRSTVAVLGQLGEPVVVDDRALGARGDDDEVAVPRGELLEREQDLLPLGAALGALDVLLGLAVGQARARERLLGGRLRLGRALGGEREHGLRGGGRVERRVDVDRAGDREQLRPTAGGVGVEQPLDPVEPAGRDPRDRRLLAPARAPARAARPRRGPPARTAAGTGRAGSASGSSPAAGRARRRRGRRPRTAAAPRDPSAARRPPPRSAGARRRSGRRAGRPRTGACAGRGAARARRRSGSGRRAARARTGRGAPGARRGRASPSSSPANATRREPLADAGRAVEEVRVRRARRAAPPTAAASPRPARARARSSRVRRHDAACPDRRPRSPRVGSASAATVDDAPTPSGAASVEVDRSRAAASARVPTSWKSSPSRSIRSGSPSRRAAAGAGGRAATTRSGREAAPRARSGSARARRSSPSPARDALVGERRVDEAVADDVGAAGERRPDHLGGVLGPQAANSAASAQGAIVDGPSRTSRQVVGARRAERACRSTRVATTSRPSARAVLPRRERAPASPSRSRRPPRSRRTLPTDLGYEPRACGRHRGGRLHRLEPRRRPPRARRRGRRPRRPHARESGRTSTRPRGSSSSTSATRRSSEVFARARPEVVLPPRRAGRRADLGARGPTSTPR